MSCGHELEGLGFISGMMLRSIMLSY